MLFCTIGYVKSESSFYVSLVYIYEYTNILLTFMLVCDIICMYQHILKGAKTMSIVRYVNKKTGKVLLYESTSYYDPEKKQSRPKRKYLGVEDPETGELIPSTKKPGRKQGSKNLSTQSKKKDDEPDYKLMYETLKKESDKKDAIIKKLESQNKMLHSNLERIKEMIVAALKE